MNFTDLNNHLSSITTGVSGLLTTLYLLAIVVGVTVIVVLSIVSMFCNEQDAIKYKRWRTNVVKAVVVALCIGAIFAIIKALAGNFWGQTNFNNLVTK
jgi:predicted ferric reductase